MVAGDRLELPTEAYETSEIPFLYPAVVLERGTGIEPVTLAWKARVIPFYEPRIIFSCIVML